MFPADLPKELTDEFFEGLARELELGHEEMKLLRRGALMACRRWVRNRKISHSTEDEQTHRATLNGLERAVSNALQKLKTAPDSVWHIMSTCPQLPANKDVEDHIELADEYQHPNGPVRLETSIVLVEPFVSETRIAVADLERMLEVIAHASSVAVNLTLKRNRGPQQDWPLETWTRDMANIWVGTLEKPFTRDATSDGEPISLAARMLVSIYKRMDPETPKSRVLNEMKKLIAMRSRTKYWKK